MNWITSNDLFGKAVNFTFDKKGNEHQTIIGGIISLFIRLTFLWYAVILTSRMINLDDNKNESFILTSNESQDV